MDKEKRMQDLIRTLNEASEAYYGGKDEIMSNYEWDALFDELIALETETGIILPNSPTQNVGAEEESNGKKEAHELPALSLNKSKDIAVLQKWAGEQPICLSWKLDGLTLVLTYDDGKLTKVLTRGNGTIGTNITYAAEAIAGIPMKIECKEHIVVRGEAIIALPDFEEVNAALPEGVAKYANARNLASGTLSLDPDRVDEIRNRRVRFVAFTLVKAPESEDAMYLWSNRMAWLHDQGFQCVEYTAPFSSYALPDVIQEWTEKAKTIEYPVDGLVIVFEDTEYAKSFSVTGHHDNGAGMAFKWQDTTKETTLSYIEWSCGATCITPVAVFAPVELEGTTVRRASLHNISEAKRLGIGADGETTLEVYKANLIIPQVAKADGHGTQFQIPGYCPVCGHDTEVRQREPGAPEVLVCTNPKCAAKELKKFVRFASKDGMDIDGLSEKRIADLIAGRYITTPTDLYKLPQAYENNGGYIANIAGGNLANRDGWGEISVINLVNAIERSRDVEMTHFLYALCIPMCGHDVSKKLVATFGTNDLMERLTSAANQQEANEFYDAMSAIDNIGPKKAEQLLQWLAVSENMTFLTQLRDCVKIRPKEPEKATASTCTGLTFVITGAVHSFKNRDEFKAYVEAHGGKVAGSVSKKTNYLVSNEPSTSTKSVKATSLGIPVITEDEFLEKF